jgi:hypothetical protein
MAETTTSSDGSIAQPRKAKADDILLRDISAQNEKTRRLAALTKDDWEAARDAFWTADHELEEWMSRTELAMHGAVLTLYQIFKLWDILDSEVTGKWEYDFWKYAKWRTNLEKKTVYAVLGVAKVFLSGEMDIPGKPDNFDPYRVKRGLLIIASHAARTGKLPPQGWAALQNPRTTVDEFRHLLAKVSENSSNGTEGTEPQPQLTKSDDPRKRYWEEVAGVVYFSEYGDRVAAFKYLEPDDVEPAKLDLLERAIEATRTRLSY